MNKKILKKIASVFWIFRKPISISVILLGIHNLLWIFYPYRVSEMTTSLSSDKDFESIIPLAWLLVGVVLTANVIGWLRGIHETKNIDYAIIDEVGSKAIYHLMSLSIGQHISNHSSIIRSRIKKGAGALSELIRNFVDNIAPTIVISCLTLIALTYNYPTVGMVAWAFALFISWMCFKIGFRYAKGTKKITKFDNT